MVLSMIFIDADPYVAGRECLQCYLPIPNDLFKAVLYKIDNPVKALVQIYEDMFVIKITSRTAPSLYPIGFHDCFYWRTDICLSESIPFIRIESLFSG